MVYREIIAVCSQIHTNSMELSPSSEANSFSDGQKVPRILWNTNVHYSTHKNPYPEPDKSSPCSPSQISEFNINIISPPTPRFSKRPLSPPKPCMQHSSAPYMLHAPPISFFFMLSPEKYLVNSTDHSAPHYLVFSTPSAYV